MALLMLSNIDPGATDEDIREFLLKYGLPAFDEIERAEGDGTRPAATLTFHALDPDTLRKLAPRIHGMFWKGHQINALVLAERFN
ncbi:RNA-binding protein [Cupriavidus sp. RAF12]|uniref:RNA-binding protein n=1 Tax=Cupriavidus sp. RAF12 TaxID=3233050 RepID=UPI003F8F75AC